VPARADRGVDEKAAAVRFEQPDHGVKEDRDMQRGFNRGVSPGSRFTTHRSSFESSS
jgi:hypothetical protein